ncbi:MAG: Caldesmon [Bacteroidetes bacterium B1(2017)]|nr:MAG: Caldesmon [Bacteroidetes bacterium B1(2017)]
MEKENTINCPNCGFEIDVNDLVFHQMEAELKRDFNAKLAEEKKKYDKEFDNLQKQQLDFEEKKKKENELFQDRLNQKLKEEKELMEKKLRTQVEAEQQDQIKTMQNELNQKMEQLKELNRTKAEIEQLKRNNELMKEQVMMEAEKTLNLKLNEERERIKKMEQDRNELHIRELNKQLEDQKRLTEEMKRKQEQGSMQLQGEVQELAIEEWLMAQFPLDTIDEIKKGARGGDCVQTVNTRSRQNCGTIYYESKRTKDFQPTWIEKFKADIRTKGATIGVLVTDVFPSDMERMGMKDGIWICSYEEFKGLCKVLRETIIQLDTAMASQENKGDKMTMLYDFLTSNTFKLQIEAIVEGFTQMQSDLETEKRSYQRIWKQREKQIEKVITNTIDMYGSIRGIAGSAIGEIKALELPGASEDIKEDELL